MNHAPSVICRLTIIQGEQGTRVEEIRSEQAPIKIGRLSSSHLQFEDASVSRIHAVIERAADGRLSLIDLGSASGTYVNGERINKQPISHGDELGFGDIRARFELIDASLPVVSDEFVEEPTIMAQVPSSPIAGEPATLLAHSARTVYLADGSQVEPFTLQGYYDDGGNYIPGYYDEAGDYHLGYGYYDDAGAWCVAFGYYDPEGTWVETEHAIASLDELGWNGPSNIDYYTDAFFDGKGGDTLEVAMLWADQVLAVNTYANPKSVIIGASEKSDFVIEDQALTSVEFPLVQYAQGAYQLVITPQMTGMIQNGDQRLSLHEAIEHGVARQGGVPGGYVISLGSRTSARIDIGDVTFLMHFTEQPTIFWPMFTIGAAALSVLGFIAISALLQGSFVAIALTSPIDPNGLELDAFSVVDRFVGLEIKPDQEEELDSPDEDTGKELAEKRSGEEGKAGKEDAPDTNKALAIKGPSDNQDIEIQRQLDMQVVQNSGALAMLSDLPTTGLFGSDAKTVGSDVISTVGNLDGTDGPGESWGFTGTGIASTGRGGGGNGDRSLSVSDIGTRGKGGRGGRGGSKYGKSAGDLGPKTKFEPTVIPQKPTIVGTLSREIIQSVVRRHRSEIRYCYETQLQKNPKLAGTVKVKFVIAGTGSVMSAVIMSSDMNNSAMEQCMTRKIQRWTFPEPTGNGIVNVKYPFKFSS